MNIQLNYGSIRISMENFRARDVNEEPAATSNEFDNTFISIFFSRAIILLCGVKILFLVSEMNPYIKRAFKCSTNHQ